MTGAEHYAEGERLLAVAADVGNKANTATRDHCVKAAQAHFAAAQVAATLVASEAGYTRHRIEQWADVLGPAQPEPGPNDPWSSPAAGV